MIGKERKIVLCMIIRWNCPFFVRQQFTKFIHSYLLPNLHIGISLETLVLTSLSRSQHQKTKYLDNKTGVYC